MYISKSSTNLPLSIYLVIKLNLPVKPVFLDFGAKSRKIIKTRNPVISINM